MGFLVIWLDSHGAFEPLSCLVPLWLFSHRERHSKVKM